MSVSIHSPDNLKSKANVVRQFLKEKCNVDITHSQSLELMSQALGFKDWNTAKAALSEAKPDVQLSELQLSAYERVQLYASMHSKTREAPSGVKGLTVGEIRKALQEYDDSAVIDFDYEYSLGEFINSIDEMAEPENVIHQEFAATSVQKVDDDYVTLKLELKEESFTL